MLMSQFLFLISSQPRVAVLYSLARRGVNVTLTVVATRGETRVARISSRGRIRLRSDVAAIPDKRTRRRI